MITTRDIEALGFVLDDHGGSWEQWLMEFDNCSLGAVFHNYGKAFELHIYQNGYTANIELKGEVTLERIKKLIEALR